MSHNRQKADELRSLRDQVRGQLTAPGDFGKRVRALRGERGLTLAAVAERADISKAYLSQVETGRVDPPRDEKVRRLEDALGARPGALVELAHVARLPEDVRGRLARLEGALARYDEALRALVERTGPASRGDRHAAAEAPHPAAAGDGRLDPEPVTRSIPIINKVAAGYPAEFTDLDYPAGVADEYAGAPPGLSDPHAFAVRVVGESMAPRYAEGDILVFSPSADVASGDDCFVRFAPASSAGEGATFKRVYFDTPDTVRLQPLNDRFPPTVVPAEEITGLYKAVFRYEALHRSGGEDRRRAER